MRAQANNCTLEGEGEGFLQNEERFLFFDRHLVISHLMVISGHIKITFSCP